ncbi:hypothetical protein Tco_0763775 [Tanacetum coccineum]
MNITEEVDTSYATRFEDSNQNAQRLVCIRLGYVLWYSLLGFRNRVLEAEFQRMKLSRRLAWLLPCGSLCGWNSTLESVKHGVLMIRQPIVNVTMVARHTEVAVNRQSTSQVVEDLLRRHWEGRGGLRGEVWSDIMRIDEEIDEMGI